MRTSNLPKWKVTQRSITLKKTGFQISFLREKLGSFFLQKGCHKRHGNVFSSVSAIQCRMFILIVFVSAVSQPLLLFPVIFHALTILMYFWHLSQKITSCHYKAFLLIIQLLLSCMFYLSKKFNQYLGLSNYPHPQDSQHKADEGSNYRYITPAQQVMDGQLSCGSSHRSQLDLGKVQENVTQLSSLSTWHRWS